MKSIVQVSPGLSHLPPAPAEGHEAFDERQAGEIFKGELQP